MESESNRKITSKEYTANNVKNEWCIREHNYGVYKFTDGYVEWLEANYVKNNKIIISGCVKCGRCTGKKTLTYCDNCLNENDNSDLFE